MSTRNPRRAAPAAAPKAGKGRRYSVASTSSTFDLSSNDNDNYSGVDDISDDEDDDEDDVVAAEEQAIMGEDTPSPGSTPRPQGKTISNWSPDDIEEQDEQDDEDDEDDEFDDDHDETNSLTAHEQTDDDSASWAGIQSDEPELPIENFFERESEHIPTRRVRFDVPSDDSSSESTEDDDHGEWYPDIFVDQSSLDPSFRRQIEREQDESSASDSFWDHTALYQGDHDERSEAGDLDIQITKEESPEKTKTEPETQQLSSAAPLYRREDLEEDLDGYESDGETTEEEDMPHPPIRRKSTPPASDGEESDSEVEKPVRHRRDQPLVSRFNLDKPRKRPVAVYNTKTGKMMIFTPDQRRHLDLSPEQFRGNPYAVDWSMPDTMSPLVGNGAGLMLDSFTSDLFMNPANINMEEFQDLFLPTADQSAASVDGDSPVPRDSDDADPEVGLRVSDFLDFDDDESSNDEGARDKNMDPSSTPLRPTTASSDADVLSHLNPATVGAFRRNQVNSQLLIRNQATQDSLDFSGPYNSTAIRGIRSDRFDTAGVPLTPARRHKRQPSDFTRSPLDAMSMKRKASADVSHAGHKKQKSISDVGSLQL